MTSTSKKIYMAWILFLIITMGLLAFWIYSIEGNILLAAQHGKWQLTEQIFLTQAAVSCFRIVDSGLPIGVMVGFALLAISKIDEESILNPLLLALGTLGLTPLACWFIGNFACEFLGVKQAPSNLLNSWIGGSVLGLLVAIIWLRYGVGYSEKLLLRLTKKSYLERNSRTDVREIEKFLPTQINQFDPLQFMQPERGIFVGLDEFKKPIYIPEDTWKLSHVLLSGRTRSNKGVAAQILLSQAIARGEFVVILDPKCDAWMPHVFHDAAHRAGQSYHFLDLRPGQSPQINMFSNCDEETVEGMLIGAFSLAEKGEAADFYRLADRKAAREAAKFIAAGHTAAEALEKFGEGWLKQAAGFHAALEEMVDLQAVNCTQDGIDIISLANTGGCLYVSGDMSNTRVIRMQRMLLVRLMMLAKQGKAERLITVFADEFKVHISRPFMTSLGAAAGWGMHCILAFQSLQDLSDVPGDLDKDSVKGAVMENCAVQLSYRIKDPDTAEWLAASTGTILVDDETRHVERNIALTETVMSERTIRQAERYLIDTNMLMNLPTGCGALVGATKLPTFCYTSPVRVEKRDAAVTPTVAHSPVQTQETVRPSVGQTIEDFI
jgi:hypothetical protein